MEGDHDGDPCELARLPAPFSSRTITVIATISRATCVAGIMPLEAGMLFRLILMPSSPGEVPTWPKATCRDQGWSILSAQGRTPRSWWETQNGARPHHVATMVTELELWPWRRDTVAQRCELWAVGGHGSGGRLP